MHERTLPGCCGRKMTVVSKNEKFTEVLCETCNDIAYIKTMQSPEAG